MCALTSLVAVGQRLTAARLTLKLETLTPPDAPPQTPDTSEYFYSSTAIVLGTVSKTWPIVSYLMELTQHENFLHTSLDSEIVSDN